MPLHVQAEFSAFPTFALGNGDILALPLGAALLAAPTPMRAGRLPLKVLAGLMAYGFGRSDVAVIDVWFHAAAVEELPAGLYRYERDRKSAQLLRRGDLGKQIAGALPDPGVLIGSAVQIFVVGLLEIATATDGERGYRTALMAAGACVRDLSLAASGLGLGQRSGDFHDREIDTFLGLDGLGRSALYMIAVGPAGV
jgi:SagB-type dehydrogenase family enzyme